MATVTRYLIVKKGNLSLPWMSVPFWGFSPLLGQPQIPGPQIVAREGDNVRIRLYNNQATGIDEPVSIIFPGQENVFVRSTIGLLPLQPVQPQYSEGKMISLTNYLNPGFFGLEYRFVVTKPGIYLYESGTNPEKQVQMGLYGVIPVWPRYSNIPSHPNYKTAYGAGTRSQYDIAKVLVLGELDTVMHNDVVPGVYYNMLDYKPNAWVINGRTYPDTQRNDDNTTQPNGSLINCQAGQSVLLRIINAGFQNHTFYLGGLVGRVVAEDSFPLVTSVGDTSYEKTGVTLGAGQSVDIIVTPTIPGEYYLYDREYNHLVNENQFPGGIMTKLNVRA